MTKEAEVQYVSRAGEAVREGVMSSLDDAFAFGTGVRMSSSTEGKIGEDEFASCSISSSASL